MFKFFLSIGRNDLTLEGHVQIGYVSKTIKNYSKPMTQLTSCIEPTVENVEEEE